MKSIESFQGNKGKKRWPSFDHNDDHTLVAKHANKDIILRVRSSKHADNTTLCNLCMLKGVKKKY